MTAITPIHELVRRIPEAGRIRLGEKAASGAPKKLSRFRFTSADRDALVRIAELYGGTVKPWPGAPTPNQSQLVIDAPKVRITLPPNPLGDGPIYELYSKGGCQRRCDGVEVVVPDSTDPKPCICAAQGRLDCKVTTRLNVILRDIPFAGVWRLDSHGWASAHEWPGSVELVQMVQARDLGVGELAVEERVQVMGGQTRRFNVAVLTAGGLSIDELASGLGSVSSLGRAPVRELEAGNVGDRLGNVEHGDDPAERFFVDDDAGGPGGAEEIEDAEIVDDEHERAVHHHRAPLASGGSEKDDGARGGVGTAVAAGHDEPPEAPTSPSGLPGWQKALHAGIGDLTKLPDIPLAADDFRHALVNLVTKGRTASSSQLDPDERRHTFDLIAELLSGERRYVRVDAGRLVVSRKRESS